MKNDKASQTDLDKGKEEAKKTWLDVFHEFAGETTLHGFLEISKYWTYLPLRIFFILSQIIFWSIMIYHMYLIISQFMAEPTLIQTVTTDNQAYEYPSLTFCPQLWLNVSRYHEIGIPKPAFLYAMSLMKRVTVNEPINLTSAKIQLTKFMDENNISTYYQLYATLANDYKNESLFCRQCATWPPKKVFTEEGVCYRFNFKNWTPNYLSEKDPKITYNPVQYANDSIYDSFQTLDFSEYIAIGMQENDYLALDPIFVIANQSFFLRVTPTKHQLLNDEFTPCMENQNNESTLMCKAFCRQEVRDRACPHLPTVLGYFRESSMVGPRWNGTPLLETPTNDDLLNYYHVVDECNTIEKVAQDLNKCETELCPPGCTEMTYSTSIQTISSRHIFQDLPEAAITITINYEVRAGIVQVVESFSYTWYSFLSDVGGLVGLWCGASVFTVIPLLTFFFHHIIYITCNRKASGGTNVPMHGMVHA